MLGREWTNPGPRHCGQQGTPERVERVLVTARKLGCCLCTKNALVLPRQCVILAQNISGATAGYTTCRVTYVAVAMRWVGSGGFGRFVRDIAHAAEAGLKKQHSQRFIFLPAFRNGSQQETLNIFSCSISQATLSAFRPSDDGCLQVF